MPSTQFWMRWLEGASVRWGLGILAVTLAFSLTARLEGWAQGRSRRAEVLPDTCSCPRMLEAALTHVERDYAGFVDKLASAEARARYLARRAEARAAADTARLYRCRVLIEDVLTLFDDGHLYTAPRLDALERDTLALWALMAGAPRYQPRIPGLPLERQLKTLITTSKRGGGYADTLLGLWTTGGYEVAIVPQLPPGPGLTLPAGTAPYVMVVLSSKTSLWEEGMIKGWLWADTTWGVAGWRVLLRDRGHRVRWLTAPAPGLGQPTLNLMGNWRRTWPDTLPLPDNPASDIPAPDPDAPTYRALSDTTGYLRLRSFDAMYARDTRRIVRQHGRAWGRLRVLVIDLRGNGGGSDLVHAPLRSYLFDGPFYQWGVEEYASEGNLGKWDLYLSVLRGRAHRGDRAAIRRSRRRMAGATPGTWVSLMPPREQVAVRVRPGPGRIVVLVDSIVASAAEQLLIDLEQAPRVVRMGTHSAGILDYANLMIAPLPCQSTHLAWPTTRSVRVREGLGIDGRGLPPHVDLSRLPPLRWLEAALLEGFEGAGSRTYPKGPEGPGDNRRPAGP